MSCPVQIHPPLLCHTRAAPHEEATEIRERERWCVCCVHTRARAAAALLPPLPPCHVYKCAAPSTLCSHRPTRRIARSLPACLSSLLALGGPCWLGGACAGGAGAKTMHGRAGQKSIGRPTEYSTVLYSTALAWWRLQQLALLARAVQRGEKKEANQHKVASFDAAAIFAYWPLLRPSLSISPHHIECDQASIRQDDFVRP